MAKNRVLILFAHPRFEQSRTNKVLVGHIPQSPHITFHDLYEAYADFNINVDREQELLLAHDIIIWHHPFYWYSAPPLLKQWIDMVLAFKWAYGPGGEALKGKCILNAITSGGPREVYQQGGRNRYSVPEFLRPFEQTARLCHMRYLPPFAVQGTHRLSEEALADAGKLYKLLLNTLQHQLPSDEELSPHSFLNDWLITLKQT